MQVNDFGSIRNDYGTDPRYGTSYGAFDGGLLSRIGRAIDPTLRGSATYATAARYVGEENLQTVAAVGQSVRAQVIGGKGTGPAAMAYAPPGEPGISGAGINIGGIQITTLQIAALAALGGAFWYFRKKRR